MGTLRDKCCKGSLERGIETTTLVINSRVYPDACLAECDDIDNGNTMEPDSNSTIMAAVKVLLQGLGEDVNRDGLRKTPMRVAKAFRDGTRGYHQTVKDIVGGAIFPEAGVENGAGCGGGSGGMVVVRNIDLFSYCEACLLPFKVCCHVGYISSGQRVVGLSKLSRVAEVFAKRLQAPQRLADEVSKALYETIRPLGVAIALECWHIRCPAVEGNTYDLKISPEEMRGWMHFSVCAGSGLFEDERSDAWTEFIALLRLGGVSVDRSVSDASVVRRGSWCPFWAVDELELPFLNNRILVQHELRCNGHGPKSFSSSNSEPNSKLKTKLAVSYSGMIGAVESILFALGEEPRREELQLTPFRFVWWLLNFHQTTSALQLSGFNWNSTDSQRQASSPIIDASLGSNDMVCSGILSEVNVPFFSQCEHHLLPFFGVAHVGYFSVKQNEQLERSKISAIVQFFSHKLQVQERLTKQIAETIVSACNAVDVMVVLEASHICMLSRGIEKFGSSTATVAVLGRFAIDPSAKAAFFQKISSRAVEKR